MLSRKGSRPITVDGVLYRWRVRRNLTPTMLSGGPMVVAVAHAEQSGQTLLMDVGLIHAHNAVGLRGNSVQPSHVAHWIRGALGAGWRPTQPGKPFRCTERFGAHPGRALSPHRKPLTHSAAEALVASGKRSELYARRGVVYVDGAPFIDWVAAAERIHIARERVTRDGIAPDVASYGPWVSFPSGGFEGDHGFVLEEDDPRRKKPALMDCDCGNAGCWLLLADVWRIGDAVVWANFEQFHRPWVYDLGPFVFSWDDYSGAGRLREG